MFIVCPKCFAQYLISDEIKVSKNQKFHCSSCGHYFVQDVDNENVFELDEAVKNEAVTPQLPEKETSTSFFAEPVKKEENSIDLGQIPQEFKPVTVQKKSSLGIVLFYLLFLIAIFGVIYYHQKAILQKVDVLIVKVFDYELPDKVIYPTYQKPVASKPKADVVETIVDIPVDIEGQLPQPENAVSLEKQEDLIAQTQEQIEQVQDDLPVVEDVVEIPVVQDAPVVPDVQKVVDEVIAPVVDEIIPETAPVADVPVIEEETPVNTEPVVVNPLKIEGVTYALFPQEPGLNRLELSGLVTNTDLAEITAPILRAVIYDEQGIVVARKKITFNQKMLLGNSEMEFSTTIFPIPTNVVRVEVVFDE